MDLYRRPTHSRQTLVWLAAVAVLVPAASWAAQLLVNGVPIGKVELSVTGLENITFEKCNQVKVEPNGDVKIDCPGYDLKAAAPATTATQPEARPLPATSELGKVSKRYWIVASQTQPGTTQFDVDLYVNKKWIRRFRNGDGTAVVELTKHLAPGDNSIIFAATKSAEPRKSTAADAVYKFIIGEGDIAGANLRLDKVDLQYQKTAADTESTTDERTLSAG
jgi:hypothetical protein